MQKSNQKWADNKQLAKESLQKSIVVLLGAGAVVLTLTSPLGAVGLAKVILRQLEHKIGKKLDEHYSEDSIRLSLYRLKKNRYIKQSVVQEGEEAQVKIELTKKGRELFQGYTFNDLKIQPAQKWDGKWRFVLYDISESSINTRNIFRDKLKKMKFFMVQKSVWAYPYPCKKEIDFITEFLNIKNNVLVFEDKIENDKRLKEYFRTKGFRL